MRGNQRRSAHWLRPAVLGWAGLAVLTGLYGCQRSEHSAPTATAFAGSETSEPVIEVETTLVRRGAVLQRISAPGSLVARRTSRIGPEVRGRIERIFVEEADRVEAGDPLFQIDVEPYELLLHQAEARLDRTRAERHKLETDLARGRELRRQDVLAEQKMDELTTGLEVARAVEHEAKERVAVARRNLKTTLVRAPYAASVAARLEDEGTTALVQPQTVVVVLQEISELEAQATIPEVYFATIREGDAVLLYVEGLAQPIATQVSAVGDVIDPATRTFLVKMRVPNPDRQLKAGIFARVDILPRAKDDVIVVPRDAVRREDGRTHVLVVRDGRAEAAPVRLGVVSEDVVEVMRGLRVDEEIVVGEKARTLGPGMRVRPLARERRRQNAGVAASNDPAEGPPL